MAAKSCNYVSVSVPEHGTRRPDFVSWHLALLASVGSLSIAHPGPHRHTSHQAFGTQCEFCLRFSYAYPRSPYFVFPMTHPVSVVSAIKTIVFRVFLVRL